MDILWSHEKFVFKVYRLYKRKLPINYEEEKTIHVFRVTHKGWDFRDDCKKCILLLTFTVLCNFKLISFFAKLQMTIFMAKT